MNFDRCVEWVLIWEQWHSYDQWGGRTLWGIAEKWHKDFVDKYWDIDPQQSRELAKAIYRSEYWDKIGGDNLPDKIDAIAFDSAVNAGVAWTMENIITCNTPLAAMMLRLERYTDIVNNDSGKMVNFRGWVIRLITLWRALL